MWRGSESEFGEEPPILAGLEPLLEALLGLLESSDLLVLGGENVRVNGILQIHVQSVARGHEVLIVHQLHEGLHPRFLRRLLRGVLLDHLARVLLDSGDQTVAVGALPGSVIESPHNHGLPSRVAALQDDHGLVWLQELHHLPPF